MNSQVRTWFTLSVALTCFFLASTSVSAAPIIIDTFALSQGPNVDATTGGGGVSTTVGPNASILGGNATRTLTANFISGVGSVTGQIAGSPTNTAIFGTATVGGGGVGIGSLQYDVISGSLNLNGFSSIDLLLTLFNNGTPATDLTPVTSTLFSGPGNSSTSTLTIPQGTGVPSPIIFGLGTFSTATGTGANLGNITGIRFDFTLRNNQDINLGGGGDIIIREIVPEPASMALFGIVGLAGLWTGRRLSRKTT